MRKRYIATSLLQMLKSHPLFHGISAIGLASSHPAGCHALTKYTGIVSSLLNLTCSNIHGSDFAIESIDISFCRQYAKSILQGSPVEYVREMSLRGSLFEDTCTSGAVSSVFTNFYVDHAEPLEALAVYKAREQWRLGELLDGHEFLIILPTQGPVTPPTDVFK